MQMQVNVMNLANQKVSDIELDELVFGVEIRKDILHRVVEWQRSKRRAGTHKTKGISEISGTTKKPYKQKGTGSARHGSLRSAQFRGGAVIFGPVVRSHEYDLTKKFKRLGLKTALSCKLKEGKLMILDSAKLNDPKTSSLLDHIKQIGIESALIIDGDNVDQNFLKAAANLKHINILPQIGANVYDILHHQNLILTCEAVRALEERLK